MDFDKILRAKKFAFFEGNDANHIALSFMNGCRYNCRYCQAKAEAVANGKKTPQNWADEEFDCRIMQQLDQKSGVYVFPAAHDINPDNFDEALQILTKILAAGNRVIITTKPYLQAVQKICEKLVQSRGEILFRFSIGSVNSQVLKYWEPDAPDFTERFEALKWAFYSGFNTSVICEPILDNCVEELIETVLPYVNGEIRLGDSPGLPEILKKELANNEELAFRVRQLLEWQSCENLWKVYQRYRHNSLIKWNVSLFDAAEPVQSGISL